MKRSRDNEGAIKERNKEEEEMPRKAEGRQNKVKKDITRQKIKEGHVKHKEV